jgi:hypothetical protein
MHAPLRHVVVHAGVALAGILALVLSASAQTRGSVARFTAVAMDLEAGSAIPLDIVVNRWSTEAEQERLRAAMKTDRRDDLIGVVRDLKPVGYFRTRDSLAWDLRFAQATPGDEQRQRIFLLTDRPVNAFEFFARWRSLDYPFTVIELNVGEGEGSGTLTPATKVIPYLEDNFVVLENYGLQRVRLTQVKQQRR